MVVITGQVDALTIAECLRRWTRAGSVHTRRARFAGDTTPSAICWIRVEVNADAIAVRLSSGALAFGIGTDLVTATGVTAITAMLRIGGNINASCVAALVVRTVAVVAHRAAVARLTLGCFVRERAGPRAGHSRVIETRKRDTAVDHIAAIPRVVRVCLGTRGRHIKKEVLVTRMLVGVTGAVADIMTVTCTGEIYVAQWSKPVGNDVFEEAILRTTSVSGGRIARMRDTIRAGINVSNRIALHDTCRLAALVLRVIRNTIAGVLSKRFRLLRPTNSETGESASYDSGSDTLENLSPRCRLAERAGQLVKPAHVHVAPLRLISAARRTVIGGTQNRLSAQARGSVSYVSSEADLKKLSMVLRGLPRLVSRHDTNRGSSRCQVISM